MGFALDRTDSNDSEMDEESLTCFCCWSCHFSPAQKALPMAEADQLIDEIFFPDARGGRKPTKPLTVEVVRGLTPADLPGVGEITTQTPQARILSIKHQHHQLASLLSQGMTPTEAGLATGYAPAYISVLKADPAFQELLAHYAESRELKFVEALERMRQLGLSTLDEIQHRLETDADGWSKRELMELAELMLVKPNRAGQQAVGSGGSAPSSGVSLTVNFVQPKAAAGDGPGVLLDLEPSR